MSEGGERIGYRSEWRGRAARGAGSVWRLEIEPAEGATSWAPVALAWEDPAVIEWGTVSKEEPVQGSGLTLRLVSESDRAFTGLYSADAGVWSVRVYRDGALYWSGTLDPELYGEPYCTAAGYEVEVTASDFGVMERRDFDLTGRVRLGDVIRGAVGACGLSPDITIHETISTRMSADDSSSVSLLDRLYIEASNFYDEEGEAMSWRKAAEGVLRPLALRMTQRGGKVEIFDLNGAYTTWPEREVWWSGADSELGVDRTYNRVRVRLSAYADNSGADGSLSHDDTLQEEGERAGTEHYWVDTDFATAPEGFDLVYGSAGNGVRKVEGLELPDGRLRLMRIDSVYSGSDTAGALFNAKKGLRSTMGTDITGNGWPIHTGVYTGEPFRPIMQVSGLHIVSPGGERGGEKKRYMLKVSMDLLLDVRYNPFESESEANEEGNYGRMKKQNEFMYCPVAITLRDHNGATVAWYDNRPVAVTDGYNDSACKWRTDSLLSAQSTVTGCSWLAWYDWEERENNCGIGGWAANKQTMGRYRGKNVPRRWKVRGDGLYIPLPPVSGYVTVTIGEGVYMSPGLVYGTQALRDMADAQEYNYQLAQKWRWLAYKDLKAEVVLATGKDADNEDLEDWAWIERGAADELEIETVVGTPGDWALPSARAILTNADGEAVKTLYRAGVTDRAERLLIGTVYSQHKERRDTLSGSCELLPELRSLTDASTAGTKYIMLGERQDLGAEQSEITMAAFGPDEWEGLEVMSDK